MDRVCPSQIFVVGYLNITYIYIHFFKQCFRISVDKIFPQNYWLNIVTDDQCYTISHLFGDGVGGGVSYDIGDYPLSLRVIIAIVYQYRLIAHLFLDRGVLASVLEINNKHLVLLLP